MNHFNKISLAAMILCSLSSANVFAQAAYSAPASDNVVLTYHPEPEHDDS
jgi:hypothetical protein